MIGVMSADSAVERALRLQVIDWVNRRAEENGGFLRRDELLNYTVGGQKLPVIDYSRGIRNPATFDSTLSIVSTANGPYDDLESSDGLLHYSYRAGDPDGSDNRKLRNAHVTRVPLILFRKEVANVYTPVAPAFVIGDDRAARTFLIAFDESLTLLPDPAAMSEVQKEYAMRLARQRLHQPAFRTRVMVAYTSRCAVCQLKYGALLDAAHILPDSDERGVPTTDNGMALCKIHHVAYDRNMLGITPDYVVKVSPQVLQDSDGPMLTHGLQEMHDRTLVVPNRAADQPNRNYLAERFDAFARAS